MTEYCFCCFQYTQTTKKAASYPNGANALNISHLALTRRRRTRQFLRTQDGTGRAAEIRGSAEAEEAPPPRAKPASPWPPTGHHLCGATELHLSKLAPEEMEGNTDSASASGSRPEERFGLLLRRFGRRLFFFFFFLGITRVSPRLTPLRRKNNSADPDLGVRDRGGRLMSLPLSTPVSGCRCLSLPGDRVYAPSGREITVFRVSADLTAEPGSRALFRRRAGQERMPGHRTCQSAQAARSCSS
ncbi:uncharacterized protein [Alexandromys fortis]|uniref:uncharacterized protein n=1 Tax=Alexandromys fortis TaxID=100897 RepID=UPI002152480E|nr:uncharacterized protein LOC126490545 [Microtus fortis]